MKTTEFKEGDWVYYYNEPAKVSSVVSDTIEVLVGSETADYRFEHCLVDYIKPMPLTREILEKNGWIVQKAPYKMYLQYRKKGNPTLNEWGDGYHFSCGNRTVDIEYVHQLQHILWALGINDNLNI